MPQSSLIASSRSRQDEWWNDPARQRLRHQPDSHEPRTRKANHRPISQLRPQRSDSLALSRHLEGDETQRVQLRHADEKVHGHPAEYGVTDQKKQYPGQHLLVSGSQQRPHQQLPRLSQRELGHRIGGQAYLSLSYSALYE